MVRYSMGSRESLSRKHVTVCRCTTGPNEMAKRGQLRASTDIGEQHGGDGCAADRRSGSACVPHKKRDRGFRASSLARNPKKEDEREPLTTRLRFSAWNRLLDHPFAAPEDVTILVASSASLSLVVVCLFA